MEKVKARKPPGFVRIINLSGNPVEAFEGTRGLGKAAAHTSSKPTTLGAGDRSVIIKGGKDPEATVKFSVVTKKVYAVVVWPDGSVSTLPDGTSRLPEDMTNGWIFFADRNGVKSGGKASIVTPSGSKMDVSAGQSMTLAPGVYKSADGTAQIKVESKYSYVFYFFDDGGKTIPAFVINSDDVQAAIAGSAAG